MTHPAWHLGPIQTPRLTVRRVAYNDLPALFEVNHNPDVTRYLPYAPWADLDAAHAWWERMQGLMARGEAWQGVIARHANDGNPSDTEQVIGALVLFGLSPHTTDAELGYVIGRPHWGCGYAQEAVQAVCAAVGRAWGLKSLTAKVELPNQASHRLLKRLGFQELGLIQADDGAALIQYCLSLDLAPATAPATAPSTTPATHSTAPPTESSN